MKKALSLVILTLLLSSMLFAKVSPEIRREFKKEKELLKKAEIRQEEIIDIKEKRVQVDDYLGEARSDKVLSRFKDDLETIKDLWSDKKLNIEEIRYQYGIMRYVYHNAPTVKASLLYCQAYIAYIADEHDKDTIIKTKLTTILDKNTASISYADALHLLLKHYVHSGQDELFIEAYSRYGGLPQAQFRFWQAQAFYNLDDYASAQLIFKDLVAAKNDFSLQSDAMLGLIMVINDNVNVGLEHLALLKEKYNSRDLHYNYILLTLARVSAVYRTESVALAYYNEYIAKTDELTNAIKFEIAEMHAEAKQNDKAKALFTEITKSTDAGELFGQAKYQLAIIAQQEGDLDLAKSYIEDAIGKTNNVVELLTKKSNLIVESQAYTQELLTDLPAADRQAKIKAHDAVLVQIDATNLQIKELMTGLSKEKISLLKSIERDFFAKNMQLENVQDSLRNVDNYQDDLATKIIAARISELDTDKIVILAYKYMSGIENPTKQDQFLAFQIAAELYISKHSLAAWEEMQEITVTKADTRLAKEARTRANAMQVDIAGLEEIANSRFGNINENTAAQQRFIAAADSIESRQVALRQVRDEIIIDNRNNATRRLSAKKDQLNVETTLLKDKYSTVVSTLKQDASTQQQRFDYTLLDILYKQSKKLDQEFEKLKKETPKP